MWEQQQLGYNTPNWKKKHSNFYREKYTYNVLQKISLFHKSVFSAVFFLSYTRTHHSEPDVLRPQLLHM